MSGSIEPEAIESLLVLLRALKLSTFVAHLEEVVGQAERGGWGCVQFLRHLAEMEMAERKQRRTERLLKQSGIPAEKTISTLDQTKFPVKVRRQLAALFEGGFVDTAQNVLAFGLPGRGKTHALCAVGHELIRRGYGVLFIPAYRLVQRLLAAKRDLALEKELRRIDAYDAVIVDDIGYIQQDREEMEVLFTFLAERYERRSVLITSNLVFSQWDRIFKDPMTTAAAIDRVVHHSVILEFTGPSVRAEEALDREATDKEPKEKEAPKRREKEKPTVKEPTP